MSFARVAGRAARTQSLVLTSQPQRILTPAAAVQRGAFDLPSIAPIRYLAPGPSFSGGMPYVHLCPVEGVCVYCEYRAVWFSTRRGPHSPWQRAWSCSKAPTFASPMFATPKRFGVLRSR